MERGVSSSADAATARCDTGPCGEAGMLNPAEREWDRAIAWRSATRCGGGGPSSRVDEVPVPRCSSTSLGAQAHDAPPSMSWARLATQAVAVAVDESATTGAVTLPLLPSSSRGLARPALAASIARVLWKLSTWPTSNKLGASIRHATSASAEGPSPGSAYCECSKSAALMPPIFTPLATRSTTAKHTATITVMIAATDTLTPACTPSASCDEAGRHKHSHAKASRQQPATARHSSTSAANLLLPSTGMRSSSASMVWLHP